MVEHPGPGPGAPERMVHTVERKDLAAMKRVLASITLALALVLSAAGGVRADMVTSWGYDWAASPSDVTAGSGKINMSNEPFHTAVGDSVIVATNLKEFSKADPASPDMFGPMDGKYKLTLTLKDIDSGKSGSVAFTGQLQGVFSSLNSHVTNTFDAPTVQKLLLGSTQFTVTMKYYTPPGPT